MYDPFKGLLTVVFEGSAQVIHAFWNLVSVLLQGLAESVYVPVCVWASLCLCIVYVYPLWELCLPNWQPWVPLFVLCSHWDVVIFCSYGSQWRAASCPDHTQVSWCMSCQHLCAIKLSVVSSMFGMTRLTSASIISCLLFWQSGYKLTVLLCWIWQTRLDYDELTEGTYRQRRKWWSVPHAGV